MTFKKAFLLIGSVLLFHAIGLILHLYDIWFWYDVPMHIAGGFVMAALGLAIWQQGRGSGGRWIEPLFIIGFVALICILWELHEFLLDVVSPIVLRQPDLTDTMSDLANGLGGGLAGIAYLERKKL